MSSTLEKFIFGGGPQTELEFTHLSLRKKQFTLIVRRTDRKKEEEVVNGKLRQLGEGSNGSVYVLESLKMGPKSRLSTKGSKLVLKATRDDESWVYQHGGGGCNVLEVREATTHRGGTTKYFLMRQADGDLNQYFSALEENPSATTLLKIHFLIQKVSRQIACIYEKTGRVYADVKAHNVMYWEQPSKDGKSTELSVQLGDLGSLSEKGRDVDMYFPKTGQRIVYRKYLVTTFPPPEIKNDKGQVPIDLKNVEVPGSKEFSDDEKASKMIGWYTGILYLQSLKKIEPEVYGLLKQLHWPESRDADKLQQVCSEASKIVAKRYDKRIGAYLEFDFEKRRGVEFKGKQITGRATLRRSARLAAKREAREKTKMR